MAKKKPADEAVPAKQPVDRHRSRRMIRLPDDLHDAISGLAETNGRPITMEVRRALLDWLARHGRAPT